MTDPMTAGSWVTAGEHFTSTHIARFRWNGEEGDEYADLTVAFYSGSNKQGEKTLRSYLYHDVSRDRYDTLCRAAETSDKEGSVGNVVNTRIKPNHQCTTLGEAVVDEAPDGVYPD
jgi:hypothetical protein